MSTAITPSHSPPFTFGVSLDDTDDEKQDSIVKDIIESLKLPTSPAEQQYLSPDYPAIKLSERVSVDNQAEALNVFTTHQTSVASATNAPPQRENTVVR
ncbi:unnamed protein product [Strongylus vulgaris]|uniref:Uncharacterized protein n=1 Tax=Strongylus vulgaris TaxID=40348 RepID=A0A3P7JLF8_STRVU|nr:unnamed protein product [Strongylus vulgaris]